MSTRIVPRGGVAGAFLAAALALATSPARGAAPSEPSPVPSDLKVASGRVERLADFPSRHVPPRNVDVWLPDGYPDRGPYAVLYMQDGGGLFDKTHMWNGQEWKVDETAGALIASGRTRPFIVVGIWNAGAERQSEYLPQKPFESMAPADQASVLGAKFADERPLYVGKVRSDGFLRFLVEELKPYVDAHYAVRGGREDTAVLGSSMGALISIYALCEYPKVFGSAGGVSTHWPGTFTNGDGAVPQALRRYLKRSLPDPATHRIYFDHGTATVDAMYPELQKQVDAVMQARGYGPKSWQTRVFPGAEHSENAWSERLAIPLEYLLPPRNPKR